MINKIKNNKIFKIISMTIKAILSFFIILIVSIIFIQRISNNKVTLGGYSIFTIISESMAPKYKIGDMVFAKKVDPREIEVGDDVVYLGEKGTFKDKIVTHQVVKKEKTNGVYMFETKGLANSATDPKIEEDQLLGVVIFKGTILSFLSRIVNNTYGFYFVIFIPLAILFCFEIIDIIAERKEKNKG